MSALVLVTIPFSHFCEKARFGLDHVGLPFEEHAHLPGFAGKFARGAGGGRTVPVLQTPEGSLGDSTDILRFCDRQARADRKLYPTGLADEVAALEDHFDEKFAPQVRRLAFFHILPSRRYVVDLVGDSVPRKERTFLSWGYPAIRILVRKALRIDGPGVARSVARVDEIFAEVGQRLAGGRRFLVGERFSAADLTFAALASPLVQPPEHPRRFPTEQVPASMLALRDRLRSTHAGAHVMTMYREFRRH